ncbi:hypothetical protein TNCV_2700801 [Trichonephila clavipes]|nr:hypothetical protein TNCV_2700801 [Trichonephila clavipes]
MANNQSVRRHLDAFIRGRIIGKLEEGRSVTSVAAEFGIAHSIVSTTLETISNYRNSYPGGRRYGSAVPFHGRQSCTMSSLLTVAVEQPLRRVRDIERMDWPAHVLSDLNPIEHVWDFSRQTLGSSYLTTNNDSGASIGAARLNGQQCLNNSLTPSFSAWADAVKPVLAVRGDHIPY